MAGNALLDKGGMPSPEQLDAMGADEATARGAQALILLSKEGSPEEQRAVKAMIDATAPEAQIEQRQESAVDADGESSAINANLTAQPPLDATKDGAQAPVSQIARSKIEEALLSAGVMPEKLSRSATERNNPRAREIQAVLRMASNSSPIMQQAAEIGATADARAEQATGDNAGIGEAGKITTALVKAFTMSMEDSGYNVKGFDDYTGDPETLHQMQTVFTQLAKDFPDVAHGLTIQLNEISDGRTIGWFDAKTNSIHYSKEAFISWKSTQEEISRLVNNGHFPAGTDARGCFYHEFGHAVWLSQKMGSLRKAVDSTLQRMGYGYLNVAQREAALKKELSEYATADTIPAYQEVIAEVFSEWYTSKEPRKFCIEFLKEIRLL